MLVVDLCLKEHLKVTYTPRSLTEATCYVHNFLVVVGSIRSLFELTDGCYTFSTPVLDFLENDSLKGHVKDAK